MPKTLETTAPVLETAKAPVKETKKDQKALQGFIGDLL